MSRYYLNAEQTGQRDVMPRPYFVDDREGDRSWLDHEHLAWEGEFEPSPYRGRGLAPDYPAEDLRDVHPAAPRRPPYRQFHPGVHDHPPGMYERGDWPGQALAEFFGGFDHGHERRWRAGAPPRMAEPDHRGRGPKGYRRSDERIAEEVCERLSDDPFIDASDISVSCRDGVVALDGKVDDRSIKFRVEDIVDDCAGVMATRNHLQVDRQRLHGADRDARLRR